ncbi:MAG: hypothetical protein U1D67_01185 [Dehalococcoidia bacterium]|nr:hypothetical protein [Dehalococcoidia bacterium]MDZ4245712.1 hypothetical protein [Dehalococcoidia bacterium]
MKNKIALTFIAVTLLLAPVISACAGKPQATPVPTKAPTAAPTQAATPPPTAAPTQAPTAAPTKAPTTAPTQAPTAAPTRAPTAAPTAAPTTQAAPAGGPPKIPHTLEGRDNCLMCHQAGGLKPFPANHAGRTNEMCRACHQPQ